MLEGENEFYFRDPNMMLVFRVAVDKMGSSFRKKRISKNG